MEPLRFTVIGLGGFGLVHLQAIEWLEEQEKGKLTGIVALDIDRKKRPDLVESYQKAGIRFFDDVNDFFENGVDTTDVLTVPIGIHQHVPVSIRAMRAGLDVYCEKPVAATIQEVDELIEAAEKTGRTIAIGYQHIYSHSINEIKKRMLDSRLGRPLSVKLMSGWPRSIQYFTRNNWTGKLRLNDHWILDSIANNACAHFVLNALHLSVQRPEKEAAIENVQAELYRAYGIESADTVAIRFQTDDELNGYIFMTHTNRYENGPIMHIRCEHGFAYWQTNNGKTYIRYDDGQIEEFDNLANPKWQFAGFDDLVDAINNGRSPLCTPELARMQTAVINAMHDSCPKIETIPSPFVYEIDDWEIFPPDTKGHFHRVKNMDEYMHIAFTEELFPSEMNVPWATKSRSKKIQLKDYSHFPLKKSIAKS